MAASEETASQLRDLPVLLLTTSAKKRQEIFDRLQLFIDDQDVSETNVQGVCQLLPALLPHYCDGKSRYLIRRLVTSLGARFACTSVPHLASAFDTIASSASRLHATRSVSRSCLATLNWLCALLRATSKHLHAVHQDDFIKLIKALSSLMSVIISAMHRVHLRKAQKQMDYVWRQSPLVLERVIQDLKLLETSYETIAFTACLAKYLPDSSQASHLEMVKRQFLDSFIKIVISSKTISPSFVTYGIDDVLKHVTHQEFKDSLLPAMQKAMLRSPEVILSCIAKLVTALTLDMSVYALEIGKTIGNYLCSNEDRLREHSAVIVNNLAQQSSDPDKIKQLLLYFVAVLNGSERKLTGIAQKIGVITGMGNLSCCAAPVGMSQNLLDAATNEFVKILECEVHEGILIHTLSMLSLWCTRFRTAVPNKFIDWYKKAITLKSSTPAVRNAYTICLNYAFHGKILSSGEQLVPILLQAVEKAVAQPGQTSVVTEGLSACVVLLGICVANTNIESKLDLIWNVLANVKRQIFVSERFLLAASDEALCYVVMLVERMLSDFPFRFQGDLRAYYRAIVFVLTRPSAAVRRETASIVKKLLSVTGGGQLAVAIIRQFSEFLHCQQTKVLESAKSLGDVNNADSSCTSSFGSDCSVTVVAKFAVECLELLCSGSAYSPEETKSVADECIPVAHHPVIVSFRPTLWLSVVRRLGLNPVSLLSDKFSAIWSLIVEQEPLTDTYFNVVKTLASVCPDVSFPVIVSHVRGGLMSSDVSCVTKEDCDILRTPPGQLYDRTAVDSAYVEISEAKIVKREHKLYSFKDQLDAIELEKEIEVKNTQLKSEIDESKMNPKQIEMMKAQLSSEAATRERVRKIKNRVKHVTSCAFAAMRGNMEAAQMHCSHFLEALLVALHSPVAAAYARFLFVELQSLIGSGPFRKLGMQLCHVEICILQPSPKLNQDELASASVRIVHLLHRLTVRFYDDEFEACDDYPEGLLPAPVFACAFPLLDYVLRNGGERVQHDTQIVTKGLEIIKKHSEMRATPNPSKEDIMMNPNYLPRKMMMNLLINITEHTTCDIQSLSGQVLVQVAESASGKLGCATASSEEINCLLAALQSPALEARHFTLLSLLQLVEVLKGMSKQVDCLPHLVKMLWVVQFDPDEKNQTLAKKLWSDVELKETVELCSEILRDVCNSTEIIRTTSARSLPPLLTVFPKQALPTVSCLTGMYQKGLEMIPPVLDEFGRTISEAVDCWEPRSGVAVALKHVAVCVPEFHVSNHIKFFFAALNDHNSRVQNEMLEAAIEVVNYHGKNNTGQFIRLFQEFMNKTPKTPEYDEVRQNVIILMGYHARHLAAGDPNVKPIVNKLISTLSTPSQQVQEAVANCLPPLVVIIQDEAPGLIKRLLNKLLMAPSYGERRGAAYGIAGFVKGLGILSLKQMGIMDALNDAVKDKNRFQNREGGLLAYQMLCNMLGRLFEPYIVHILPTMLICLGDKNKFVRVAANETARAVMSQLSVHGVKIVLPVLLKGLDNDSWLTKVGSVELLSSMAFCAPKQLGACLPSIVPKLIEVMADSHYQVQGAGRRALNQIGSVIMNPEIQTLVPMLLEALNDPSKKTSRCLQTLLATKFVHFIDAASLALIMPVVQRAFKERGTETRKMAAQIIGNMYSVTDKKDLSPYLPAVLPGLKYSLLDPVPEVRSVSSRALGTMVKGMGDGIYDELMPWLMQHLTSETSAVDRSGAAQGLSEVVGGCGLDTLHRVMPDIIATAQRSDLAAHVRDGYIMTFIYMPVVFQADFTPYIGQIINPILKALADENEYVRETAYRAGQRIINTYADSAVTLLLPELERGLFHDNWRIRYSSVQLLGDLLFRVSGVSGKKTTETASEDDNFGTEKSHKAILKVLGEDRRNRVLAGLYMGRMDVALMVRQSALHVWKVVVTNTPKTLREILPTLFALLLGCLASTSYDKRQVAAKTLGDLVRKLGERVLPEIIPILESGLESDRADQRQGVCVALSEIMTSTSREMILTFGDILVPTVRKALCDPLPEVRRAAAKTFESLYNAVGQRALDDILLPLLSQLGNSMTGAYSLDGLRQVMAVKSKVVLPYLIPQLTTPPVNMKALSILGSVAGEALTRHLVKVLPALLSVLSEAIDTANEKQELDHCEAVILSVTDPLAVHTVIDGLLEASRSKELGERRAATMLLCSYCSHSKADYGEFVPQLLRGLIRLLVERDERVLQLAWEALGAVTKDLDASEQVQHVGNVRQAVRFAAGDLEADEPLPGFCQPKGVSAILPIFREAVLNGAPELKEQAATGLGELIRLTTAEALRPSVVNITGPLIRVLGDRFSWNVRVAVLDTLALLLAKVGVHLKPFLPQLQTTFVKALGDPSRQVRLKAAAALGHLIVIHTKADPLFAEIHAGVCVEDVAVRETMLHALRCVVSPAGNTMGAAVRRSVLATLQDMLAAVEDSTRAGAAGCLGALCRHLPENELADVVAMHLVDAGAAVDPLMKHGRSVALMVALKEAPDRILTANWSEAVIRTLMSHVAADKVQLVLSGIRGVGFFLRHQLVGDVSYQLLVLLAKSMNHPSNEVKQLVAQVAGFLARSSPDGLLPDPVIRALLPMLVNGTKEKNSVVKANSEYALVAMLHLRTGDVVQQQCMKILDAGAREALSDVVTKVLRKMLNQPEPKEEDLDNTLLT